MPTSAMTNTGCPGPTRRLPIRIVVFTGDWRVRVSYSRSCLQGGGYRRLKDPLGSTAVHELPPAAGQSCSPAFVARQGCYRVAQSVLSHFRMPTEAFGDIE